MTPAYDDGMTVLLQGEVREVLAGLEAGSVHMAVTSPPFWSLRRYQGLQAVEWGDGTTAALGLEKNVSSYIAHLVECFAAVKRVLRDDGTLWVELNDSYAGSNMTGGTNSFQPSEPMFRHKAVVSPGIKPLDRCGVPERFALAMQADGWFWRDTIIYHHTNAMPESVAGWSWERCRVKVGKSAKAQTMQTSSGPEEMMANPGYNQGVNPNWLAQWADCPGCLKCKANGGYVLHKGSWRTTKAHSYVFMFSKTASYYADGEDVRQSLSPTSSYGGTYQADTKTYNRQGNIGNAGMTIFPNPSGANLRSVWSISSQPMDTMLCAACDRVYSGKEYRRLGKQNGKRICRCGESDFWVSHYAAFPEALVRPMILAGTSARGVCPECGAPWARMIERERPPRSAFTETGKPQDGFVGGASKDGDWVGMGQKLQAWLNEHPLETLGWLPTCKHRDLEPVPATVLDPFVGTGTTSIVAKKLGRRSVGIDLSPEYNRISARRLERTQPGMVLA